MAQCNDCWCEHYDKSKGNCDQCVKNKGEKDSPDVRVLLQRRIVKQMEAENKNKNKGQTR
jgi:hypothetical protein